LTAVIDQAAKAATESSLRQAAAAGITVLYREIKVRAMPHYRTGVLEDGIMVTYVPEESLAGVTATYMVTFSKNAWYARLVEYGKSDQAPKPFIRPAFEAKKKAATDAAAAKLQEVINSGR
jgi:HK97 gp10 family phage protein